MGGAPRAAAIAMLPQVVVLIQGILADELEPDPTRQGDATLLAAFFVAGYSTVMVQTARRLTAGEPTSSVADDHRAGFGRLFDALRSAVVSQSGQASGVGRVVGTGEEGPPPVEFVQARATLTGIQKTALAVG